MKRNIYLLIFAIIFASCQNEEIINSSSTENLLDVNNDKEIIRQLGYSTIDLIDCGEFYLIEGDIALNKNGLREYAKQSNNSQYSDTTIQLRQGTDRFNNGDFRIISDRIVRNITISTTGVSTEWHNATKTAIETINNISGCCVKFNLIPFTTQPLPNIVVSYKNGVAGNISTIAWTELPTSGGNPARNIYINELKEKSDSHPYKAKTMLHELGHSLGLMHTHGDDGTDPDRYWDYDNDYKMSKRIPGTPLIDNQSFMSSFSDDRIYPGFTKYDLIALRFLYPEKKHELKFKNSSSLQVGFNNSIYLANPILDVNYTLTIDGADLIGSNGAVITGNTGNRPISNYQEVMFRVPSNMVGRSVYFYLYMNGDLVETKTVPVSR